MTIEDTRDRFGYQWTHFDYSTPEFEEHFRRFLGPMKPEDFVGKTLLDAGCGYGRYAAYAEAYGAKVVGMDFSEAIDAAREIVKGKRISLVQGDILNPPFRSGEFELVMSLGVLHHLPDPREGFAQLVNCLVPGGKIVLWLYSAQRRWSIIVVEILRKIARRLPNNWLRAFGFVLSVPDFALSKLLGLLEPVLGEVLYERFIPTHFRLYSRFPFRVCWADWFDRLGAPIRHYHTRHELEDWIASAGLEGSVTPTEDFGWTLIAWQQ
ncbi:MAG: class I SAM-dependent methyltransferase [Anaerolineales bacterium]